MNQNLAVASVAHTNNDRGQTCWFCRLLNMEDSNNLVHPVVSEVITSPTCSAEKKQRLDVRKS